MRINNETKYFDPPCHKSKMTPALLYLIAYVTRSGKMSLKAHFDKRCWGSLKAKITFI